MDSQNLKIVLSISKAFSGMLFLLFLMMLTDITECGMKNDFTLLRNDPGIKGLYIISAMTIINVLIQVSVFSFHSRPFKYFILILSILYTLFFLVHQILHLMSGEGIDIHFFLDITHHILGAWAILYAYKWVQLKI